MTCLECEDVGLIPYVPADYPKPNAEISGADLHFAVCLCASGQAMRLDRNEQRSVAPQWRVWCARFQVDPSRVTMVEDVFSPEELQAAAFSSPERKVANREAAMLAVGKKQKR